MAVVAGIVVICFLSFSCGRFVGSGDATRSHWQEQCNAANEVFGRDPAYANVRIAPTHDGGSIILEGEVATEDDKRRLVQDLTQAFGKKRAEFAVLGVQSRSRSSNK